mmetsp:Transcript_23800/g.27369  ORF Transcript_23800/g.27369 Transcript_23800/m.27369 type:complete len:91 (-) Transcript_23800:4-276(-)
MLFKVKGTAPLLVKAHNTKPSLLTTEKVKELETTIRDLVAKLADLQSKLTQLLVEVEKTDSAEISKAKKTIENDLQQLKRKMVIVEDKLK